MEQYIYGIEGKILSTKNYNPSLTLFKNNSKRIILNDTQKLENLPLTEATKNLMSTLSKRNLHSKEVGCWKR